MTIAKSIAAWGTATLASLSLLAAGLIGAVAASKPALAQFDTASEAAAYYDEELDDIEWEQGEGYHVEEWYDPSDWFDTDEGVEYEYDDYGYYGDTSELYDADDDWYYDYYDDYDYDYDVYSYQDGIYNSARDYYDYDNDGVYDAYATYYDWDGDGVYEDYNYYNFANFEDSDQQTQTAQQQGQQQAQQKQQQSSKDYEVTGEVQKTKKVQVRGGKNLVAQVKAEQGTINVDLGPADEAGEWNISQGTKLSAHGPVTKVGEKQVMLAQKATIDQNKVSIDRSDAKLSGTIKSLKKVGVRGTQHQLAVVDVKDKQKKVLVDMGSADKLKQNFSQGDEITVHGMPIRAGERPTLMAKKLDYQGQTIKIDRSEKQKQQSKNQASSTNG